MNTTTINVADRQAQVLAFLNQGEVNELPDDDNSFYVFGSKTTLNNQIQAVLRNILAEKADKTASVFVHYGA